jgi:hypothetical protein
LSWSRGETQISRCLINFRPWRMAWICTMRDERADAFGPWSPIWIRRNGSPGFDRLVRGRIRRRSWRDDLKVAFADVLEGAAVSQGKIVELLAAKGAGDHPAPMTLVPDRCPQFQHTFLMLQRQTRLSSLVSRLCGLPAGDGNY